MARINLLPWRAERRQQRQREFYGMLGFAAVAGLLLSLLLWFYYDRQVSGQQERNAFLQTEIDKVKEENKQIDKLDEQKARLLARKAVIEELQAKRSQMVHLFDSLVRTIPDGVVLTALKQEGDILTLEGRTQSNARVSAYMRNLESSGWMKSPELSIIEAKAQEKGSDTLAAALDIKALPYVFIVKVTLPAPGENVVSSEGAATDMPVGDGARSTDGGSAVDPANDNANVEPSTATELPAATAPVAPAAAAGGGA